MNVKQAYPGTESTLYSITGTICQTCSDSIDAFAQFKAKYTPAFFDDILKQAEIAKGLPNNDQRQSTVTGLRKQAATANQTVCANFMALMKYVQDGFAQSDWDNKKKAAGNGYYDEAWHEKFRSTTTLIGMATSFIKTYASELATGNMPDSFPGVFVKDSNAFAGALANFMQSKGTSETATTDKVNANNQLYANLQGILSDGKYIFRDNPAMKKQFSYAALLRKVKKNGKTGFRITLTDATTLLPVSTAIINIVQGAKTFVANEKGIIIAPLPEGTYNYTVTAPGYTPAEGVFTATTGIMQREKITLNEAAGNTVVA